MQRLFEIPCREPVSPNYIHVNPVTNQIHLMVKIVAGDKISTDNTCKAALEFNKFCSVVSRELIAYRDALLFDIALLAVDHPQRVAKEERLVQINTYIAAVALMNPNNYQAALAKLMDKPSNLYSIQLRPRAQDVASKVVNPVFNINRTNDSTGTPNSALYNAMYHIFPKVKIATMDPCSQLIKAALQSLPASPTFNDMQRVLGERCLALFGVNLHFTRQLQQGGVVTQEIPVTQEYIDQIMGFSGNNSADDYIEALLGLCAPNIWITIPTPPFYSIPIALSIDTRTERLSILTQFCLAHIAIYCQAQKLFNAYNIRGKNIGEILDESPALSQELVEVVSAALAVGAQVEKAICEFCNRHYAAFDMSRILLVPDIIAIQEKFAQTYRVITASPDENSHMDDFLILDQNIAGMDTTFFTHNGCICVDFSAIANPAAIAINPSYFERIRNDFLIPLVKIPNNNPCVAGMLKCSIEDLFGKINDEQFYTLAEDIQVACRVHPLFCMRQFLYDVAKGKQLEATACLIQDPNNTQNLLRAAGISFMDYSGRIFNCTAYEYAYWAKDTHMCRMLEQAMDQETKAFMLQRIEQLENNGLQYQQNGAQHCSQHFSFEPLLTAYDNYFTLSDNWTTIDYEAAGIAWLAVGKAQRDLPAHIAQEYCRPDRSFNPLPKFNELILPRMVHFSQPIITDDVSCANWFPLCTDESGLGFSFGILRAGSTKGGGIPHRSGLNVAAHLDYNAIVQLHMVRTADLEISKAHLQPSEVEPKMLNL